MTERASPGDDEQVELMHPLRALADQVLAEMRDNPLESLCALVGVATSVFYWAEHGRNREVETYWDALHYIATSLSVGYARTFPVTPLGKAIGSFVMMIGPALSARALSGGEEPADARTVAKLDEILTVLRRMGPAT